MIIFQFHFNNLIFQVSRVATTVFYIVAFYFIMLRSLLYLWFFGEAKQLNHNLSCMHVT